MKNINNYILEKLKINNTSKHKPEYTLFPTSRGELIKLIKEEMVKNGKNCDLNHIDVSKIVDMSQLFYDAYGYPQQDFNGDISQWNVSNVTNMKFMFYRCKFNGDISQWNVSKVENMAGMFSHSNFNDDISEWNVSNVTNMHSMFEYSDFNNDISNWDISNVEDMYGMFYNSKFNQDISNWVLNNHCNTIGMFKLCAIKPDYKPKKPKNHN